MVGQERAVQYLQGVRGVTNKLVVRLPQVQPEQVREVIEDALERSAAHAVKRIAVLLPPSQDTCRMSAGTPWLGGRSG
jgi:hypothetical protein